ncbi:MAG: DUF2695 domain-containing protein [Clostridia bacterium]|nr:DUF2695 domain-containing protein [Clostridia bacterium]
MADLSKEEKKFLMKEWKTQKENKYNLSKTNAEDLFQYLETQLDDNPCDDTLRYTKQWLKENLVPEKIESAIEEIEEMGGYCDCEVLSNCYEEYDIV